MGKSRHSAKRLFMRSMAQKRLTAVGRVAARVAQICGEIFVEAEFVGVKKAEGDAHGGGDADGGSAADDHGADGLGDLLVSIASDVGFHLRQAGLVDHDDARVGPLNCFYHFVGSGPDCVMKAARKVML